jgi:hypothetical protein
MGSRQMAMVPEQINEQRSRLHVKGLGRMVDGEGYFHKVQVWVGAGQELQ